MKRGRKRQKLFVTVEPRYSHTGRLEPVMCQGADSTVGHPMVFLFFCADSIVQCPYCATQYVSDSR